MGLCVKMGSGGGGVEWGLPCASGTLGGKQCSNPQSKQMGPKGCASSQRETQWSFGPLGTWWRRGIKIHVGF